MTKKGTNPAKASAVVKKALAIYDDQKATYQKILKTKVRQGKKVTTAAKEASKVYKDMYGATPTARWHKALRAARTGTGHGGGTLAVTNRPERTKRKKTKK